MFLPVRIAGGLGLLLCVFSVSARAANLADPEFLAQLARITGHAASFGSVCVDSSGKLLESDVRLNRPVDGFPIDTVSCKAEWANSNGVLYEAGHLTAYADSSYTNWEDYRFPRDSTKEPHPATYAEAWATVGKIRARAGVPAWTPAFGQARCASELKFESAELPLPRFNPAAPVTPGELKTVAFVKGIESILASPATCAEQRSRISALFAQSTVSDARDWAWISWAARHSATFLEQRMIRLYVGAQSQMARLHPTRDHDAFSTETFLRPVLEFGVLMSSLIRFNLAVNGTESDALEKIAPGKGFAQFSSLPQADRERWLDLVAFQPDGLSVIFTDGAAREERLVRFRDACDLKLAGIFGGPGAVVSGSGYEQPIHDTLGTGASNPRWHVFSNLHIYDGARGDSLFIPAGLSGLAGGTDENACFASYYRKFGNYGATRLVSCHLARAAITRNTNAKGSVEVGQIGGPGGSGGAAYSHSHLILYTSDRTARLNFVDAFCR
jgi:hypothetical protein